MTCLTADPEETTRLQHHDGREGDPGAQMMRTAAGEEAVEGGEAAEAGLKSLRATRSTSLDRSRVHGGTDTTLTRVLAVAPASSSEPSSCETPCDLCLKEHEHLIYKWELRTAKSPCFYVRELIQSWLFVKL